MDETYNSSYIGKRASEVAGIVKIIKLHFTMFSFVENSGNFSECSLTAMKEKVEDLKTSIDEFCFEDLEFDANFEVEISQCGNYIGKISNCAYIHMYIKTEFLKI